MSAPRATLLDDTPARDYTRKLQLFNAFAAPELRDATGDLRLRPGMRVLDAGCGSGEALAWLGAEVGPSGLAVGLELSRAHACSASAKGRVLQADLMRPPVRPGAFDAVWCVNTLNHLKDPVAGIRTLMALTRSGGRIAVGQSSLLPDMYFAWDSRLERVTNEAVRRYYRDRYGLSERDLAGVRAIVGWLKEASLRDVSARTLMIERTYPLGAADEAYLLEAIFRGTWGERLRPYLAPADYEELAQLCNPNSPAFALRRADFHFLQTFTVAVGEVR
jgi:SAM-dependent methyltransferase